MLRTLFHIMKSLFYSFLVMALLVNCKSHENNYSIGFGKVNLSDAGIYEDPISSEPSVSLTLTEKFRREDKFAISDRVEGRWRPGSGGIRKLADSIYVSAMYGEDHNGAWTVITIDDTTIGYSLLDHLMDPLTHQLGISKNRILILPTHSHATPKMDRDKYQQAVLEAVIKARNNLSEVEIASLDLVLNGHQYVINRRVHVEGIGTQTVMFNDDCEVHENYIDATSQLSGWVENLGADPEKYLAGKKFITDGDVDNNLQALFIRDKKSGDIKGSFLRFAAHPVIVSAKVVNGDVSGDFPGYLKSKIEKDIGGVALFGQGPCGDLRPLNKEYSHIQAKDYGEKLASEILMNMNKLQWEPLTELAWFTETAELPLLENLFLTPEELHKEMDELEAQYDKETDPERRRIMQNRFWGLYRTPGIHGMVRPEWKENKHISANVYALQFNEKVLVAAQGEVFYAIGEEMIKPFINKKPILVSLANEYISYIPTDEERPKGGYESSVSILKPGSPSLIVETSHRLLNRIYGN
jgi:hypothetical protein